MGLDGLFLIALLVVLVAGMFLPAITRLPVLVVLVVALLGTLSGGLLTAMMARVCPYVDPLAPEGGALSFLGAGALMLALDAVSRRGSAR